MILSGKEYRKLQRIQSYIEAKFMDSFFHVVAQLSHLSAASRQALTNILRRLELPKGELLLKPGAVCNYLYFIERGLTRTFYYKEGKDVTDWISTEHAFAVSVVSFITRKPDIRGIELLEPSVVYSMHHDELEKLCSLHHDIERMVRQLVSLGLIQLQAKIDELHFSSALQRYQSLITNSPGIIQRVPLGMIASYLGITQETLSRIRGQI